LVSTFGIVNNLAERLPESVGRAVPGRAPSGPKDGRDGAGRFAYPKFPHLGLTPEARARALRIAFALCISFTSRRRKPAVVSGSTLHIADVSRRREPAVEALRTRFQFRTLSSDSTSG